MGGQSNTVSSTHSAYKGVEGQGSRNPMVQSVGKGFLNYTE